MTGHFKSEHGKLILVVFPDTAERKHEFEKLCAKELEIRKIPFTSPLHGVARIEIYQHEPAN